MFCEMTRNCPDCNVPLELRDFEGVQIDACAKCAGIFFDEGEVNRIKARGLAALDALEDAVVPSETVEIDPDNCRKCPSCGTGMDKFRYMYNSDLFLDECEKCGGVWVQDGELHRMRQVLEKNSLPRAVSVARTNSRTPVARERTDRLRRFLTVFSGS